MQKKLNETEIEKLIKDHNIEATVKAMRVIESAKALIALGLMTDSRTYVKHGIRHFNFCKKDLTALIATALLGEKIKD